MSNIRSGRPRSGDSLGQEGAGRLEFSSDDVAFLFVPEEHHEAAVSFLAMGGNGNGPAYACPILDPLWDDDQIQTVLAELAPTPS